MSRKEVDLIIRGGRVIDPANNFDDVADVVIDNGKVKAVSKVPSDLEALETRDATGCIVTPGLIDLHLHCYEHATPLGINPDTHCLSRGVTTIVDGGSSGASTFRGLRRFIADNSACRVLAFLHIAKHGLAAAGCAKGEGTGGESDSLHTLQPEACARCIRDNRDMLVGVKVRLTTNVCNDDPNTELGAFKRALEAARGANVPLMVHHSFSSVPIAEPSPSGYCCPGSLSSGDIYTHMLHCHPGIVDAGSGKIYQEVWNAHRRGVIFDVGHGQGSFNWEVAETCGLEGLYPDTISTDLHTGNVSGPTWDLPIVMSKFLHLRMPLPEIVKAVTSRPAEAIGWQDRIGSLGVDREADVTVLRIGERATSLPDSQLERREVTSVLEPVAVYRAGRSYPVSLPQTATY